MSLPLLICPEVLYITFLWHFASLRMCLDVSNERKWSKEVAICKGHSLIIKSRWPFPPFHICILKWSLVMHSRTKKKNKQAVLFLVRDHSHFLNLKFLNDHMMHICCVHRTSFAVSKQQFFNLSLVLGWKLKLHCARTQWEFKLTIQPSKWVHSAPLSSNQPTNQPTGLDIVGSSTQNCHLVLGS